jgi:hypothetical protein
VPVIWIVLVSPVFHVYTAVWLISSPSRGARQLAVALVVKPARWGWASRIEDCERFGYRL